MATKKKAARKTARKTAPKRKAPAKRKAASRKRQAVRRVANAPMPALAQSAVAEPPKRNGYILVAFVAIVIAAVFLRSCRENGAPEAAAPAAPAVAAPEGRSVATSVPSKPAAPAAEAKPGARRETAGEHAGETGEPAMEFDRAAKSSLKIRAWRPADGQAQVDVFGPRNQRVRTLKSAAGAAGTQTLEWDGKDEAGKTVPGGLYYVRPSSQGLQQVRDVWVKG